MWVETEPVLRIESEISGEEYVVVVLVWEFKQRFYTKEARRLRRQKSPREIRDC